MPQFSSVSSVECLILFLQYLRNYYSSMSETLHCGILVYPLSKNAGYRINGFTNWDLYELSQGDLFQDCSAQQTCTDFHVSLFHLQGLKILPQKVNLYPIQNILRNFIWTFQPEIYQFSLGVLFRDESQKGLEPLFGGIISPRIQLI